MLLALDTATQIASVALYDGTTVLAESSWRTFENHTRSLMPEVVRVMELVGARVEALTAIGVATGPGSFTGLRIGLSAAKGLAFSRALPLIAVPTLDITAAAARGELPVCALLIAGRARYAAALYDVTGAAPLRRSEYWFGAADALLEMLSAYCVQAGSAVQVVGEVDEKLAAVLSADARVRLPAPAERVRRAGYLAVLAWQRWQAGEVAQVDSLAPFYTPTASLA